MTTPLVVDVDGSEASLQAVDRAAGKAVGHEIPLHLLCAVAGDHEPSDGIGVGRDRDR
ncbi:hypothetical protein [Streptomyces sp. NPDC088812]|uniref:hypothetical protein n=1 Tax=Streptomyces sp. NPDC088812 TaxID=3365905 RepID=UPI00381F4C98